MTRTRVTSRDSLRVTSRDADCAQVRADGVMRRLAFTADGSPAHAQYDVVMLGDNGWETVSTTSVCVSVCVCVCVRLCVFPLCSTSLGANCPGLRVQLCTSDVGICSLGMRLWCLECR